MNFLTRWLAPCCVVGLTWTGCSCSSIPESPPGPGPTAEPVPFNSQGSPNNGTSPGPAPNPIPATPVRPPPSMNK